MRMYPIGFQTSPSDVAEVDVFAVSAPPVWNALSAQRGSSSVSPRWWSWGSVWGLGGPPWTERVQTWAGKRKKAFRCEAANAGLRSFEQSAAEGRRHIYLRIFWKCLKTKFRKLLCFWRFAEERNGEALISEYCLSVIKWWCSPWLYQLPSTR